MKIFFKIILFISLILSGLQCFSQEVEPNVDSLYLREALQTIEKYNTNEELRKALIILQEQIHKDQTAKAFKTLKNADPKTLELVGGKAYVDSILYCLEEDEYFHQLKDLTRDSVQLSLYDIKGHRTTIWTNTPKRNSERYWLYKSATDSLGFWVHSLPTVGVKLIPDFDIYQESQYTEEKSAILIPIPIRENPEAYRLVPFRKYRRIIKHWNSGCITNIGFSQSYFEHWVKGGENNIAANFDVLCFANYKKKKTEWESYLRWKYGLIQSDKIDKIIRNEDVVELNSKFGLRASKKWYYSAQVSLKTQLFSTYNYKNEKQERLSDFLSPGHVTIALGMDYKPSKRLSLLLAPVTGKLIYMKDIENLNGTTYGIEKGKHTWQQLGPYFKGKWKDKLFKSVHIDSSLELFSNYADHFGNIDVDWSTTIDFRINYFMSTRLSFQMIYDDDVEVPLYRTTKGVRKQIGTGQRLQFNQNLSLGFVFRV